MTGGPGRVGLAIACGRLSSLTCGDDGGAPQMKVPAAIDGYANIPYWDEVTAGFDG
jgi:hypothetical protein